MALKNTWSFLQEQIFWYALRTLHNVLNDLRQWICGLFEHSRFIFFQVDNMWAPYGSVEDHYYPHCVPENELQMLLKCYLNIIDTLYSAETFLHARHGNRISICSPTRFCCWTWVLSGWRRDYARGLERPVPAQCRAGSSFFVFDMFQLDRSCFQNIVKFFHVV